MTSRRQVVVVMIARKAGQLLLSFLWAFGKFVAVYVAFAAVLVIVVVIAFGVWTAYHKIQARQEWALVAIGTGGDPIELNPYNSYESYEICESARQEAGREYLARGSSIGLKCQGVKSWLELLRPRSAGRR